MCVMSSHAVSGICDTLDGCGLLVATGLIESETADAARNELFTSIHHMQNQRMNTVVDQGLASAAHPVGAVLNTISCSPLGAAIAGRLGEDAALCGLTALLADPGAEQEPPGTALGGRASFCGDHEPELSAEVLHVVVALGVVDRAMGPLRVWPCTHTDAFQHEARTHGIVAASRALGSVDMGLESGDALLLDDRLVCSHGANVAYHSFPWAVSMRRSCHLVATFTSARQLLRCAQTRFARPPASLHPALLGRLSLVNMREATLKLASNAATEEEARKEETFDGILDGGGRGDDGKVLTDGELVARWNAWHQEQMISPLAERYLQPVTERARGFAVALKAAAAGDVEGVRRWLDSPSGEGSINARGGAARSTLLMRASSRGHAALALELLSRYGADANVQDVEGSSALHAAAHCGHIDCIDVLLRHGANVDVADRDGERAVSWALAQGHAAAVALLSEQWFRPRILHALLSEREIDLLLHLWETVKPVHDNGSGHATIYLHAGQREGRGVLCAGDERARILARLIETMRASDPRRQQQMGASTCDGGGGGKAAEADDGDDGGDGGAGEGGMDDGCRPGLAGSLGCSLTVRCCELHRYDVGGALMNRDHRDSGSSLTLSVTLSDPKDVSGGQFVTWEGVDGHAWSDSDTPTVHHLGKGDGILFRSEDLHNVLPVTRGGPRLSLVIELWARRVLNNVHRYK